MDEQQEFVLRKQELDIKQKELELKEKESRSGWAGKLALFTVCATIIAAALGAAAQAVVAYYNNKSQLEIENKKAEAARILEVVDTAKPTQTLKNLQFLVETELISGDLREKVQKRLTEMQTEIEERIADPFREIRHDIVDVIGNPIRGAILASDAYQAVYQHAFVIWIRNLLTIFVLPRDQTQPNNPVIRHREGYFESDQRFFNDEELKKMFPTCCPEGKSPPHGGLAALWHSDPEKWQWIGWRGWHCRFINKVYLQVFENGTVIGPLRVYPDQPGGQVFIIPNSGRWLSLETPTEASECGTVMSSPSDHFPKPKNP
jgi:hypothetical protein